MFSVCYKGTRDLSILFYIQSHIFHLYLKTVDTIVNIMEEMPEETAFVLTATAKQAALGAKLLYKEPKAIIYGTMLTVTTFLFKYAMIPLRQIYF